MNEEQREEFLERLCETIVEGMPLVDLKNIVWDQIYSELIDLSDSDLELFAEDYQVEVEL
jgi:hypothetical protein